MNAPSVVSGLSASGLRDVLGKLLRVAILLGALFTLVLARMDVPVYVLIGAVLVSMVALYLSERRHGTWWLLGTYLGGFVLFALLRTLGDETGISVKAAYAVDAERWLFAGTVPTDWLQRRLYEPHSVGTLEIACAAVYVSYYFAAHLVALVFWRKDPPAFKRYGLSVLVAVYAGLVVSFAVPTAPPWLAASHSGAPNMSRILADVLGWNPERAGDSGTVGTNPYAAMPSLHLALTTLVVLGLWRYRRLRLPALLYAAAMSFTLVYTGEHYVVDELAGAATAAIAWLAAGWLLTRQPTPQKPKRKPSKAGLRLGELMRRGDA
ncbi:MAG: phosphatase PAP2 family protein [Gaiellaceae bacterium]